MQKMGIWDAEEDAMIKVIEASRLLISVTPTVLGDS